MKKYEKMTLDDATKLAALGKLQLAINKEYQKINQRAIGRSATIDEFFDINIAINKIRSMDDDCISRVYGTDVHVYGKYTEPEKVYLSKFIKEVINSEEDNPETTIEKHRVCNPNAAYRQPKKAWDDKWWRLFH